MSESRSVRFDVDAGIATITLNRPSQRNALNQQMCIDLLAAVRAAGGDDSVRVVIVRGAGPAFCAGADLKERVTMSSDEVRARRLRAFAAYDALEQLPQPSIAIVHGPAVGSGCEIATACDFIVATESASFRYPEASRGTVGATQRLPRIVGKARAKELLFTGRTIDSKEAQRIGLVARVVPNPQIESVVTELSTSIAASPPLAMRLTKRAVDRGTTADPAGALAVELLAIEELLTSDEWRAGATEFVARSGSTKV